MAEAYRSISEALEALPKGSEGFKIFRSSGGRPQEIPPPDGDVWTAEAARRAALPKDSKLTIRPLVGGKMHSRRISLDFSMEDHSVSVESPTGGPVTPGNEDVALVQAGYYVQERVVDALVDTHREDREDLREMRAENARLRDEMAALRVEVAELQSQGRGDFYRSLDKGMANLLSGPGGTVLADRLMSLLSPVR